MCREEWLHNRQDQEEELPGLSLPQVSDGWHEPGRYILNTRITPKCVPLVWFNCSCLLFTFFLHRFENFSVFSSAARKTKKLNRLKGNLPSNPPELTTPPPMEARSLVPKCMPQLVPTMLSLLKAIEPDTIYAGYDSTLPDTSTRLMTTLNRLGGRQVISAVKWAKALPGW